MRLIISLEEEKEEQKQNFLHRCKLCFYGDRRKFAPWFLSSRRCVTNGFLGIPKGFLNFLVKTWELFRALLYDRINIPQVPLTKTLISCSYAIDNISAFSGLLFKVS